MSTVIQTAGRVVDADATNRRLGLLGRRSPFHERLVSRRSRRAGLYRWASVLAMVVAAAAVLTAAAASWMLISFASSDARSDWHRAVAQDRVATGRPSDGVS